MFGKLLKYDLRAVFKYWWMAAVLSVGCALTAGTCINVLTAERFDGGYLVYTAAILGAVFSVIGIIILPLMNQVLIYARIYKHFFTDEGYLTFTLPVKKHELLNSKLLMALIFNLATGALLIIDILMVLLVGIPGEFLSSSFWGDILSVIASVVGGCGVGFTALYAVELLLLSISGMLFSVLLPFICLTVACLVARKHKVFTAIAIYYVANSVISGISQTLVLNESTLTLLGVYDFAEPVRAYTAIAMVLLILVGGSAAMTCGAYILENYLLDKKLNLD